MSRYRWCSFCTHAFREADLAEDEYGLPACPYCAAPGMYLRAWAAVRSLFPELPDEPEAGQRYRLAETTTPVEHLAEDVIASRGSSHPGPVATP